MPSPWLWHSAALLVLVTVASANFPSFGSQLVETNYPLPRSVTPTAYVVDLHPQITEGTYNGSVKINIHCLQSTSTITLHAHEEINITDIQIINLDNNIAITNISRNASSETISISVEKELENGASYKLYMQFNGQMDLESNYYNKYYGQQKSYGGFYCSDFRSPGAPNARWILGIPMTPKSLRKAFPCFDEPSFKATFKISVTHWSNMSAISMMPIESSNIINDDLVYDHFSTTPLLSTSSVGIVISNFEKNNTIKAPTAYGDFSVNFHFRNEANINYLPISQMNSTDRILEYLQDYLEVPYPLPKLDIVSLSNLFYERSTSSLGLITIQEYLMSEGTDEISHEIANQWFKHMITPERWEYFNITDMLSYFLVHNALDKLGIKLRQFHMQKSDLYSLIGNSYNPGDLWAPYSKLRGSWFLEMLNSTLTARTMRIAFQNLIKNNMYNTYTPDMVWEEMTKQAHADGTLPETITVQQIAHSWINNESYPILTITRNYDDSTAKLQQRMYNNNATRNLTEREQEIVWWIPINYITNNVQSIDLSLPIMWMGNKEIIIHNLPNADTFIIVNPNDSGMFMVNYDKRNWDLISESLLSSEQNIPVQTRKKILLDLMLLASLGEINYATVLNVTLFLFNETDYSIWMPFLQNIYPIEMSLQHTSAQPKFYSYIRLLLSPIFGNATQPDYKVENPGYITFWYQAKGLLDRVGYQPFINELYTNLNKTMTLFTHYDNETELTVFCPQIPTNESEWSTFALNVQQFTQMYSYLQRSICKCPGYVDYVELILNNILDGESSFASYEFYQFIQLITTCPESQNLTLNYFLEHFEDLKLRFYYVKDVWNSLLTGIVSKIRNEDQLRRMTEFFEENEKKFGYSTSTMRIELQNVKTNIMKNDTRIQDIETWLDEVLPRLKKHEL